MEKSYAVNLVFRSPFNYWEVSAIQELSIDVKSIRNHTFIYENNCFNKFEEVWVNAQISSEFIGLVLSANNIHDALYKAWKYGLRIAANKGYHK